MKIDQKITWKVHLRSSPEKVFSYLTTDEGREKFWAEKSRESNGLIRFSFINGDHSISKILAKKHREFFMLEYFDSIVSFQLEGNQHGGTDLTLINERVKPNDFLDHFAGWVSVLMALKAAVDYGVDLRNHDSQKTWDDLYLDN